MHATIKKIRSISWFSHAHYIGATFIFFGLLLIQEFLSLKNSEFLPFVISLVAILSWLSIVLFFSEQQKLSLQQNTKTTLFIMFCFLVLHFAVNIIDIYNLSPLPPWFYTFKLYRFVSLTGLFLVQSLIFFCGVFVASRVWKSSYSFATPSLCLIALFVAVIALTQLQQAVATLYDQTIQMSINAHVPFADRFTYKQGGTVYYGWIWPYSQFIIKHTPDNAVLMLPPQSNVWKMEGNSDYFRWFMYPRTLVHAVDEVIPVGSTHILIALGECGEGECGWPKITIPAERIKQIILIDRETQVETTLNETEYHLDTDRYQWGIIELQPL
jgi:hypothetical protein